jgi:hypothetical protein
MRPSATGIRPETRRQPTGTFLAQDVPDRVTRDRRSVDLLCSAWWGRRRATCSTFEDDDFLFAGSLIVR